jgi:hypothetical protein
MSEIMKTSGEETVADSLTPGAAKEVPANSDIKHFRKPKHVCQNQMLQCINEAANLSVNGSKDSEYNDLIQFERHFHGWDYDIITLDKLEYGKDEVGDYVYVTGLGVFSNIGIFARRLQSILPYDPALSINVMYNGDELTFHIYDKGDCQPFKYPTYVAKTHTLNQCVERKHQDGYKWNIKK